MESESKPRMLLSRVRTCVGWLAIALLFAPIVVGIVRQVTGLDPTPRMDIAPVWFSGWNIACIVTFSLAVGLYFVSNPFNRQTLSRAIFPIFLIVIQLALFYMIHF